MKILARGAAGRLRRLLRTFPAVLVYGPRQCGKSTLVRTLYPDWRHLDLERPADLFALEADLEGFFDRHPRRVAVDEAQRLPDLFSALRHAIDRAHTRGRFLLTGSASPGLRRSVSESLAGRVGLLELTPFQNKELVRTPYAASRWFWGGYPPVHARRGNRARNEWLDAYVSTFLERDLPSFGVRLPPQRLRLLWSMLTHIHGNLLNVSDLARSLGVSSHTVANDLDVLEATFMIRRLPPYHANIQKRLTKSPKIYVRDTGLLHFLAGLREPAELERWPRRGHSFEGLVIEELAARAAERLVRPGLFFWRTQAGAEVDLLIVDGRRIVPIEIKLGAAVEPRALTGLRHCMEDLSLKRGFVVTTGRERRSIGRSIEIVPWEAIVRGDVNLF
ncbi:MAG: ATP-binding protein [Thermoanaerobaculia bacterium]